MSEPDLEARVRRLERLLRYVAFAVERLDVDGELRRRALHPIIESLAYGTLEDALEELEAREAGRESPGEALERALADSVKTP